MLAEGDIDAAISQLANAFLTNIRFDRAPTKRAGWGQYLGPAGQQIGLYGTCSGIISISLAHGGERVPEVVTDYLNEMWNSRKVPGSEGAKNFSLTARCAFFALAMRLANDKRLRTTHEEVTSELLSRINSDSLFKPWQIDATETSHASSEVATSFALLAFSLAGDRTHLPDDLLRSAAALQRNLERPRQLNEGVSQLLSLATASALGANGISQAMSRRIARTEIHTSGEGQDTLDFWDYVWMSSRGPEQRRDYMHLPWMAVELLLASTTINNRERQEKAATLASFVIERISSQSLFYGGREIATSKSQAWIALALRRSKHLAQAPQRTSVLDRLRNLLASR